MVKIHTIIFPSLLNLATSEQNVADCAALTSQDGPSLTIQFTPSLSSQVAPTSTVYGAIMTSYLNVVDCKYVTVENVDNNPPVTGEFHYRTFVPTMTIYRVGCMVEATTSTRKDLPAGKVEKTHEIRSTLAVEVDGTRKNDKRMTSGASTSKKVLSIAEHLASGIDPTNQNITVRHWRWLIQINTALFAINLVNSGLPLMDICQYLRDPSIGNHLEDNYIDQQQCANIVCFAAQYGLYFGTSNDELLADLAGLEFAIQMNAYGSISLAKECERLNYQQAGLLGVDVDGIKQNVCNGTDGRSPSSTLPSSTAPPTTATPLYPTAPTGGFPTGTGWRTISWPAGWTVSGTGTGASTSYPGPTHSVFSTGPMLSGTGNGTGSPTVIVSASAGKTATDSSIIFGSDGPVFSSATAAAGTVTPWFNTTLSVTTATADVFTATTSGNNGPAETLGALSFYNPPRLVRDRVARHARGIN